MTPEDWQILGSGIALTLTGAYTAWKSRAAERQTRATGNGFAGDVTISLDRICRKLDVADARMERIETKLDRNSRRLDDLEER